MQVVGEGEGGVVFDDEVEGGEIEAAGGDVRGEQDGGSFEALGEGGEGGGAEGLGEGAVEAVDACV